ncbi:MAG: cutinase family protein [Thermoleophilia bacterium]|nr:cutinase family protein [Thermoleophilia bacterium]
MVGSGGDVMSLCRTAAGGRWTIDGAAARRGADAALSLIDPSDSAPLVVYVPGTSTHAVPDSLQDEVARGFGGDASVVMVDYPATWDFRSSAPTGAAALRTVLDSLADSAGARRVMLVGESQGAWIIGEVLTDPARAGVVDRAVLLGHPGIARTHYPSIDQARAGAAQIVEINNARDTVPRVVNAPDEAVLDTLARLTSGQLSGVRSALRVVRSDPRYCVRAGVNALSGAVLRGRPDPHVYDGRMREAVDLLRSDPIVDRRITHSSANAEI